MAAQLDIDISDFGTEAWRALKVESQERRASNRSRSAELLKAAGIEFEERNHGAHLIVTHGAQVYDFWPGTGLWTHRATRDTARGVHSLMRAMGVVAKP